MPLFFVLWRLWKTRRSVRGVLQQEVIDDKTRDQVVDGVHDGGDAYEQDAELDILDGGVGTDALLRRRTGSDHSFIAASAASMHSAADNHCEEPPLCSLRGMRTCCSRLCRLRTLDFRPTFDVDADGRVFRRDKSSLGGYATLVMLGLFLLSFWLLYLISFSNANQEQVHVDPLFEKVLPHTLDGRLDTRCAAGCAGVRVEGNVSDVGCVERGSGMCRTTWSTAVQFVGGVVTEQGRELVVRVFLDDQDAADLSHVVLEVQSRVVRPDENGNPVERTFDPTRHVRDLNSLTDSCIRINHLPEQNQLIEASTDSTVRKLCKSGLGPRLVCGPSYGSKPYTESAASLNPHALFKVLDRQQGQPSLVLRVVLRDGVQLSTAENNLQLVGTLVTRMSGVLALFIALHPSIRAGLTHIAGAIRERRSGHAISNWRAASLFFMLLGGACVYVLLVGMLVFSSLTATFRPAVARYAETDDTQTIGESPLLVGIWVVGIAGALLGLFAVLLLLFIACYLKKPKRGAEQPLLWSHKE